MNSSCQPDSSDADNDCDADAGDRFLLCDAWPSTRPDQCQLLKLRMTMMRWQASDEELVDRNTTRHRCRSRCNTDNQPHVVHANGLKALKGVALHMWKTHLRDTERHLPYVITQRYLPPDTSERALPQPQSDSPGHYLPIP